MCKVGISICQKKKERKKKTSMFVTHCQLLFKILLLILPLLSKGPHYSHVVKHTLKSHQDLPRLISFVKSPGKNLYISKHSQMLFLITNSLVQQVSMEQNETSLVDGDHFYSSCIFSHIIFILLRMAHGVGAFSNPEICWLLTWVEDSGKTIPDKDSKQSVK